jgi:hypothetical protein
MDKKKKRPDESLDESTRTVQKRSRIGPTFRVVEVPATHNGPHSEVTPMPSSSKSRITTLRKGASGRRSQQRTVAEERTPVPIPGHGNSSTDSARHVSGSEDVVTPDPPLPDIENLGDPALDDAPAVQQQKPKRKRKNTTSVRLRS